MNRIIDKVVDSIVKSGLVEVEVPWISRSLMRRVM